jgi:periplasmic protein TonB
MRRAFRTAMLLWMQLLLAVCSAVALEPKEDETTAAAPQSRPGTIEPDAMTAWKLQVSGLLERSKDYPAAAMARGEEGTVYLSFTLDRAGHVTNSHIARSSGSKALDDDALEMLSRAEPFPPMPPDMTRPEISLSVPVSYHLPPCGPITGWFQRHCWGKR